MGATTGGVLVRIARIGRSRIGGDSDRSGEAAPIGGRLLGVRGFRFDQSPHPRRQSRVESASAVSMRAGSVIRALHPLA